MVGVELVKLAKTKNIGTTIPDFLISIRRSRVTSWNTGNRAQFTKFVMVQGLMGLDGISGLASMIL